MLIEFTKEELNKKYDGDICENTAFVIIETPCKDNKVERRGYYLSGDKYFPRGYQVCKKGEPHNIEFNDSMF